MITRDKLYIGGIWAEPSNPELLEIRSPHDQSVLGRVAQATNADIDRAVAVAREAFDRGPWPRTTPRQRQEVIRRLNTLREARADEVSAAISAENGSALWFTKMGQPFLTSQVTAYLKAAEELGWEEIIEPSDPTVPYDTIVRREAIGVVAAVIPWNSPFSAATAKLVPALLAGNTVVLKVSPENSISMMLLANLFTNAGLPEGVLSILPADRETSEHLISHPDVDKIAFTGSTRAGRRPMIRLDQQQLVISYIELGIEEGARLVTGGPQIPEGLEKGNYVTPTLFADVDNSMRIAQEEIFGPVLCVIAYDDADDAIRIANDSQYGLSGGVWSASTERALDVARRIRTGTVTINGSPISFDGPFGGYKASGTGREYGMVGLSEYLEYKTVTRKH
jgi:acyl-CoA reductase-like NAD-dependent aldehyde dehydrogenase